MAGTDNDEIILQYGTSSDRIVFTYDKRDFMRLSKTWAAAGRVHAGILYCSPRSSSQVASWITKAIELYPDTRNLTLALPLAE